MGCQTMEAENLSGFAAIIQNLNEENSEAQYQEYQLEVVGDHHPLQDLIDDQAYSQPIILLYHLLQVDAQSPATPDGVNETVKSLDGSPLKLQNFQLCNGTPTAAYIKAGKLMQGIPVQEARNLVSLYTLAIQQLSDLHGVLPFWVLCDGQDGERLVAIETHVSCYEDGVMVESFNISSKGPVQNPNQLPEIQKLFRNFSRIDKNLCTVRCQAEYSMLGAISDDQTLDRDLWPSESPCSVSLLNQSSLKIGLSWDQLTGLLQMPPLDAKARVYATVAAGDMRSAAHHLYEEFTMLQGIAEGLKTGLVHWSNEENDVSLEHRVVTFMDELYLERTGHQAQKEEKNEDILFHPKILQLIERLDLDFTERLWNILKDCSSLNELLDCLTVVFDNLKSGKVQPMVHKSNHCQLATLVRDSYYGNMSTPSLEGATPLEILVEIGIEKLTRDYTKAFIGQDLVTADCLQFFSSSDENLTERLTRIEKMYCCLELILLLENFLNIPQATLSIIARHALKHYKTHMVDPKHVFILPVPTKSMVGLEKWSMCKWKAEVVSHQVPRDVHSVFQLTTKPPQFSHIHLEDLSAVEMHS